jgi:hypothetical protein
MNISGKYPALDVKLVTTLLTYVRGEKIEIQKRFDLRVKEEIMYLKLKRLKYLKLNFVTRNYSKYCNL